jgi:hypothetical protein
VQDHQPRAALLPLADVYESLNALKGHYLLKMNLPFEPPFSRAIEQFPLKYFAACPASTRARPLPDFVIQAGVQKLRDFA